MLEECIFIEKSNPLQGTLELSGAKNAVLVIMASLILTSGVSKLSNVPSSSDVLNMIELLNQLGAEVEFDSENCTLIVDTTGIMVTEIPESIMNKMRASILVMGPLLARFSKAVVALPGGCSIGARPIDFHLTAFKKFDILLQEYGNKINAIVNKQAIGTKVVFEYPSVGATENILMFATLLSGQKTKLINVALEPEVLDLISVLKKMGAKISIHAPAIIEVVGVPKLNPVNHKIIPDRLEAGTFLIAAAITIGELYIPNAPISYMDVFLEKLIEMGHYIAIDNKGGLKFKANSLTRPISFKTMPYPGFPTDLQAPTMALLTVAQGLSSIDETVFENRLTHVKELNKLGSKIETFGNNAKIFGVEKLYGTTVKATDIRAGASLLVAGLRAEGTTCLTNIHHIERGYNKIVKKLNNIGASVKYGSKDNNC